MPKLFQYQGLAEPFTTQGDAYQLTELVQPFNRKTSLVQLLQATSLPPYQTPFLWFDASKELPSKKPWLTVAMISSSSGGNTPFVPIISGTGGDYLLLLGVQ